MKNSDDHKTPNFAFGGRNLFAFDMCVPVNDTSEILQAAENYLPPRGGGGSRMVTPGTHFPGKLGLLFGMRSDKIPGGLPFFGIK